MSAAAVRASAPTRKMWRYMYGPPAIPIFPPPAGLHDARARPARRGLRSAGRDVEAHVVELERVAHPRQHGVYERLLQLLGELGQVRTEGHGPSEGGRLLRPNGLVLQPAAHVLEPGPPQALLGLLRAGEVPLSGEVAEVGLEALVGGHLDQHA